MSVENALQTQCGHLRPRLTRSHKVDAGAGMIGREGKLHILVALLSTTSISIRDECGESSRPRPIGFFAVELQKKKCRGVLELFSKNMVIKISILPRTSINIDGRPLPTTKRRRTSSKACAPHLLHACSPHFHIPVT